MEKRKSDRRQKKIDVYIDRRVKRRRFSDVPYTIKMSPTFRRKKTFVFAGVLTLFLLLNVLDFFLTVRGVAAGGLKSGTVILSLAGLSFTQAALIKFLAAIAGALILFKFRYFWATFLITFLITFLYALMVLHQFLFQFFSSGFRL